MDQKELKAIEAKFQMVISQRDRASNDTVEMAGRLSVALQEIEDLKKKLEECQNTSTETTTQEQT